MLLYETYQAQRDLSAPARAIFRIDISFPPKAQPAGADEARRLRLDCPKPYRAGRYDTSSPRPPVPNAKDVFTCQAMI